jgi:hypothetical protein
VSEREDGYSRARARSDAVRDALRPLGEHERPLGIKLAVALTLVIAAANIIGVIAGVGGAAPAVGLGFAALMIAAAAGLWQRQYLVVLAFEALLAVSIIYSALSLAFASNLGGVALALGVIVACSPIFWLLIRVMARLQVPPE